MSKPTAAVGHLLHGCGPSVSPNKRLHYEMRHNSVTELQKLTARDAETWSGRK